VLEARFRRGPGSRHYGRLAYSDGHDPTWSNPAASASVSASSGPGTSATSGPSSTTYRDTHRDDEIGLLATAKTVIGLGSGVLPTDYQLIEPLRQKLDAEFGATRRVTDQGWLPHSRKLASPATA